MFRFKNHCSLISYLGPQKYHQLLYQDVPAWVTAAFAVAVFSGTLGAVFLLLKKKIASTFFILSFVGIVTQMSYGLG